MKRILALLILVASTSVSAAEPDPRAVIANYLNEPDVPGEVFSQAQRFDHFKYRAALRLAVAKDRSGLLDILQYNGRTSLIGAGGEDHAAILVALLSIWGDAGFSQVLQSCSPKAVSVTRDFLEYGGASKRKFPRTFSVHGEGANNSFKPKPLGGSVSLRR